MYVPLDRRASCRPLLLSSPLASSLSPPFSPSVYLFSCLSSPVSRLLSPVSCLLFHFSFHTAGRWLKLHRAPHVCTDARLPLPLLRPIFLLILFLLRVVFSKLLDMTIPPFKHH